MTLTSVRLQVLFTNLEPQCYKYLSFVSFYSFNEIHQKICIFDFSVLEFRTNIWQPSMGLLF